MRFMPARLCLQGAFALLILTLGPPALFAQWLNYPTADVPRTADGKPNLSAPAPRTADGKPDFSGMWGWEASVTFCGAHCSDMEMFKIWAASFSTSLTALNRMACRINPGPLTRQERKRRTRLEGS